MNKTLFFILNGNNGATYIVNTSNLNSIKTSLKFYKPRSFKAIILKIALTTLSWVLGKIKSKKLKNTIEVDQYLNTILKSQISFNITDNSSVLISPTKDKVIVNHHKQYFQKFAVGNSFTNVKKEAQIYKLFQNKPKHFQVSKFLDPGFDQDKVCTFKLSNTQLEVSQIENVEEHMLLAMVEFFNYSQSKTVSVASYINKLKANKGLENVDFNTSLFNTILVNYGESVFPLGLVHRDFKPWNVILYKKPLIFDFEETVLNGPPLEDLFNFYIDPIVRYKSPEEVFSTCVSRDKVAMYNKYLKALNIDMDYKPFLLIYLLVRVVFWRDATEEETSQKYLEVLNQLSFKN